MSDIDGRNESGAKDSDPGRVWTFPERSLDPEAIAIDACVEALSHLTTRPMQMDPLAWPPGMVTMVPDAPAVRRVLTYLALRFGVSA